MLLHDYEFDQQHSSYLKGAILRLRMLCTKLGWTLNCCPPLESVGCWVVVYCDHLWPLRPRREGVPVSRRPQAEGKEQKQYKDFTVIIVCQSVNTLLHKTVNPTSKHVYCLPDAKVNLPDSCRSYSQIEIQGTFYIQIHLKGFRGSPN